LISKLGPCCRLHHSMQTAFLLSTRPDPRMFHPSCNRYCTHQIN
jgi:hypothetical protein